MGKSVGLSLTGRWSTGARRGLVRGVWSLGGGAEWLGMLWGRRFRCSVADDATASFDVRDLHRSGAGSSSGEGSPGAEQEVLAGSPVGRTSTITTRQKFLRADPGLEAVEWGWNGLRP